MVGVAYVGSYNGRMEYSGRAAAPKTAAIDPVTGTAAHAGRARTSFGRGPTSPGTSGTRTTSGCRKYNAFQLKAQQRFAEGFTSMLSYTWSRTVDTSSGWFDAEGGIGGRPGPELLGHRRRPRHLELRHPAHPDLGVHLGAPVRAGKALAERRRRLLDPRELAAELDAARPLGPADDRDGRAATRPTSASATTPGPTSWATRTSTIPTPDLWFNTAAFAAPVNAFGNSDRNILRAPSFWNVDLTLQKNIPFGGERQLELRAGGVQRLQPHQRRQPERSTSPTRTSAGSRACRAARGRSSSGCGSPTSAHGSRTARVRSRPRRATLGPAFARTRETLRARIEMENHGSTRRDALKVIGTGLAADATAGWRAAGPRRPGTARAPGALPRTPTASDG